MTPSHAAYTVVARDREPPPPRIRSCCHARRLLRAVMAYADSLSLTEHRKRYPPVANCELLRFRSQSGEIAWTK